MLIIFPSILLCLVLSGQHQLMTPPLEEFGSPQFGTHIQSRDVRLLKWIQWCMPPRITIVSTVLELWASLSFIHIAITQLPWLMQRVCPILVWYWSKKHGPISTKFQKVIQGWGPNKFILFIAVHFITFFVGKDIVDKAFSMGAELVFSYIILFQQLHNPHVKGKNLAKSSSLPFCTMKLAKSHKLLLACLGIFYKFQ